MAGKASQKDSVLDAFRRWGYLQADLDPLGFLTPALHPELEVTGKAAEQARRFYCGTVAAEFMHIPDPARRQWIQERIESEPSAEDSSQPDAHFLLERLVRADVFEQVLHTRYLGAKRFSLEGVTAVIPLLDELLTTASDHEAEQAVVAMSHRGRLNVMAHILGKDSVDIFAGFEDVDPRSVLGSGDVKYHVGATGNYTTRKGGAVRIHMVSNPSHLEAVDPVALGRARAKQDRMGEDAWQYVVPLVLHGDSAFAGQGVWHETLNLSELPGYHVGGAVHIIVNNLIGYTTRPKDSHSTRFASDAAKRSPVPIFHVNGEDPDAVVRVARLAMDYRYEFWSDVIVDVIGFRRYGHSEIDDPTITQPLLYGKIKDHPQLWQIYAERIAVDPAPVVENVRAEYEEGQRRAKELEQAPLLRSMPTYWDSFEGGPYKPKCEVDTGVPPDGLASLAEKLTSYPAEFSIHPKVKKLLEQRAKMGRGEQAVDYGFAEALAFASLLVNHTPVRFSGQDSRRGTFNHRHAVLIDNGTEAEYIPLANLSETQATFQIYDSPLSEEAVLGFEYGYSRDYPDALVLWEAQFGDFFNTAQAIVDQFISAGEDKWGLLSGLVLLLPHGYEGQGPEHSSARIERFLQLAGADNIQVCQPSTAAQYFHLLRRQALRPWRKPLVVFTPKSMLRHPDAASSIEEFSCERFFPVLPEQEIENADRILVCTGKIGHELKRERKRLGDTGTAIVFLEQLYPFPEAFLEREFARHASARAIVWVQEEPANMGAYSFVDPRINRIAGGRPVRSVKRSASGSPATGSAKAHQIEQKTLLALAFHTHKR
jgi:2-oxoglutarate dehydrogenase E1 component